MGHCADCGTETHGVRCDACFENQVIDGRFTIAQLRAAFENVAPKDAWKGPIDDVINRDHRDVVEAAIRFFTGSEARFKSNGPTTLQVRAAGYYAAVGA